MRAMMQHVKNLAVKGVKPLVGDTAWQTLRSLDPATREKERRRAVAQAKVSAAVQESGAAPKPLSQWDLPSLARHFGTDKWGRHRYAQHYERHLARYKNDAFTLLEIGIGGYAREKQGGSSLRMWKEFFPQAEIVGLDIQDKSFVEEERIRAYMGSQTDEALLRTIVAEAGNLQVIVDDGSHRPDHIRASFEILFPLLQDGGVYAIEDIQTSYWPRYGGSLDLDDKATTMGLVKSLVDGLQYEEWRPDGYEPTYTDLNIVGIHCYHNLIIIDKGSNREGTNRGKGWDQ